MKNLFLVSPVAEFHRWTPEMDVTPRNLRILEGQLQWVRGILDLNGYEVRTSLDLAEIPEQMGGKPLKTGALALLFRSDAWNRQMEEKARNLFMFFCLMANRFATVMLNIMTIYRRVCQYSVIGPNTFMRTTIRAKAAAALDTTER